MLNYGNSRMVFETLSGELEVVAADGYYDLDFPSRMPVASALPEPIEMALSIKPLEVLKARDYVLVYDSENDIRNIEINRRYFDQVNLGHGGVIVTARGIDCDFVSRFFTPQATILEDPVTGSAHCSLIPFWAQRLGKNEMFAMQLSERVGKLTCLNKGERVIISGHARTYSAGWLYTE
jgi:predicted PhzF superfamily epimerase YddE/YHI9